jgi:hypothetical protein
MTPVMGRHSVMLNPDSVRRVTPPTTMTARTRTEESKSQCPTTGGEITGSGSCRWADAAGAAVAGSSSSAPFDEKKRGSSADLGGVVVVVDPRLENAAREYGRVQVRIRMGKETLDNGGLRVGWCRSLLRWRHGGRGRGTGSCRRVRTGTDKLVVLLGERRRALASGPSSIPRANTDRELCRTVNRGPVGVTGCCRRRVLARHGPNTACFALNRHVLIHHSKSHAIIASGSFVYCRCAHASRGILIFRT